jgi:hypothetical protein
MLHTIPDKINTTPDTLNTTPDTLNTTPELAARVATREVVKSQVAAEAPSTRVAAKAAARVAVARVGNGECGGKSDGEGGDD